MNQSHENAPSRHCERALRSLLWRLRPAHLQAEIETLLATAGDEEPALAAMYARVRQESIAGLLDRVSRHHDPALSAQRRREQFAALLQEGIESGLAGTR